MTGQRPPWAGQPWSLLAAGLLGLLSLGLPWAIASNGTYRPGSYVPGFCTLDYDYDGFATLDCMPGSVLPGLWSGGPGAIPGYATDIRVWVAAAVLLVVLGVRRRSRRMQLIGAAVAAVGWGLQIGSQAGQIAYLIALALLVLSIVFREAPAAHMPA
jgi:hypothetical protein